MGGHLNGPVGDYTDPTVYVDKLPQPFRLVDKLLAEIVENALNVAGEAERAREEVLMNKSDTVRPAPSPASRAPLASCRRAAKAASAGEP